MIILHGWELNVLPIEHNNLVTQNHDNEYLPDLGLHRFSAFVSTLPQSDFHCEQYLINSQMVRTGCSCQQKNKRWYSVVKHAL